MYDVPVHPPLVHITAYLFKIHDHQRLLSGMNNVVVVQFITIE